MFFLSPNFLAMCVGVNPLSALILSTHWALSIRKCMSFSSGKYSHMTFLFNFSYSISGNFMSKTLAFLVSFSNVLIFSHFWSISLSFSSTLWKMGLTSKLFVQFFWFICFGDFFWWFVCLLAILSLISKSYFFLFSNCFLWNNLFLICRYVMFFQLSENFVNGFESGGRLHFFCFLSYLYFPLSSFWMALSLFSSAFLVGGYTQISAELLPIHI